MLPPQRDSGKLTQPLQLHPLPNGIVWGGNIAYLDRDGVIIRGFEDYVNTVDEIEVLPLAASSIGSLRRSGFRVCVVTNQSPIGRGIWPRENLASIHAETRRRLLLEDPDAHLDLILHSPYAPWENSWARKPNPGMLEASRQIMDFAHTDPSLSELKLAFGHEWDNRPSEEGSVMVGDRGVDMKAADSFGVRGIRCDPDEGIGGVIDSIRG